MKKMMFLMLTLMLLGTANVSAQVKIGGDGTTGPVAGAVLELDGARGALLLPRVDTLDIAAPVEGMQVYRPSDKQVYTYDGTSWNVAGQAGVFDETNSMGAAKGQTLTWDGQKWTPDNPTAIKRIFNVTATIKKGEESGVLTLPDGVDSAKTVSLTPIRLYYGEPRGYIVCAPNRVSYVEVIGTIVGAATPSSDSSITCAFAELY